MPALLYGAAMVYSVLVYDLMEAFSNEVEEMGITLKAADFNDI